MRKRITSLLLTLVMLLSLVPAMGVTASAADGAAAEKIVNTFEELQTAVNSGQTSIKLGQNIDTAGCNHNIGLVQRDRLTFTGGQKYTLDLNGKTLTLTSNAVDMLRFIEVLGYSTLTITDSSSAKTG